VTETSAPVAGPSTRVRPDPRIASDPAGDDGWSAHGHGEPVIQEGEAGGHVIRIPEVPVRKVVALGLIGTAGLVLLFLLYLVLFTPLTASRNQQHLVQSLVDQPAYRYGLASGRVPPEGSPVAVLTIPAVGLHQVVVEGTSAADLMNGPGLMPGTALPGTPGNAVIAGRRLTFGAPFGSLGQLRRGDRVRIVDGVGSFTYKVTRSFTVTSGEHDVITPTTQNRITLITSNSALAPDGRFVVVGTLMGSPLAVPTTTIAIPTYELGLSGDPAAGGLAVLWSLLSVLVLIAAGLAVWRWRRPWLTYVFATPVFVACGLFACESIARALPATL
jgi:sortase A